MADNKALLAQLIQYAHQMGATDVHLSPGLAPDVVVMGKLYGLDDNAPKVTDEILREWAQWLCGDRYHELDDDAGCADAVATVGKVRVRFAFRRQRGGTGLTARLLPVSPPTIADLKVPTAISGLIGRGQGLVLVSGPTGSGKSTLMAAMVNEVNASTGKHILTIEDPVEYQHPQLKSRITQREVGLDCDSFASALRAALRARPNIVVVGEMRDTETARAALDAASKGVLVFTTSHACSTTEALEGFVGMFPVGEQRATASRLASVFQAVVVQQLLPSATGQGVVPARELLLRTNATAGLIREMKFNQIYNALTRSDEAPGMFKFEEDLLRKLASREITRETALSAANVRQHLNELIESSTQRQPGGRR